MRRAPLQFGAWVLGVLLVVQAGAAELTAVAPELWDRPRSARAVMEQPVIRDAVRAHLALAGSRLVIHHGLGQNPLLQAEELRAWLMALAVDAASISLVNDAKSADTLMLEVQK